MGAGGMMKQVAEHPGDEQHGTSAERTPDTTTILDNVVRLDQLLDDGSRRELGTLPFLELSKHMRIKRG